MKSFRITKSKEQIEEQRKVEEHSLKELSEFFNLLIFELMWAVDSTTVSLMSPAATSFCPSTPCAVIAATQVNL